MGGGGGNAAALAWAGLPGHALAFRNGGAMGSPRTIIPSGMADAQQNYAASFPALHAGLAALPGVTSAGVLHYDNITAAEMVEAQAARAKAAKPAPHPAFIELEVDQTKSMGKAPAPRLRWTPQLHRRFKDAVDHLGGPANATPKAIVAAMQVKDLTVFHVKSHLQKYRTMEAEKKAGGKKAASNGRNGVGNGQANRKNGSDGPSTSGGSDSELKGGGGIGQVLKELQALKGELKSQVQKYEEAKQVIASHSQALECIQKICREKGWSLSGNSSPEATIPGPSPQERKSTSPVPLIT